MRLRHFASLVSSRVELADSCVLLARENQRLRAQLDRLALENGRLRQDIDLVALCIHPSRRQTALAFVRDGHDIARLDETET